MVECTVCGRKLYSEDDIIEVINNTTDESMGFYCDDCVRGYKNNPDYDLL